MYLIDVRGAATTKLTQRGLLEASAVISTMATFPGRRMVPIRPGPHWAGFCALDVDLHRRRPIGRQPGQNATFAAQLVAETLDREVSEEEWDAMGRIDHAVVWKDIEPAVLIACDAGDSADPTIEVLSHVRSHLAMDLRALFAGRPVCGVFGPH
jgi:hypothetical protein